MTTTINLDYLLDRIRQRVRERTPFDGYCPVCEASITEADISLEECRQCGAGLVQDESSDEHLHEDDDFNGWELGYDD